ncbi:MAG TPA: hypothetical protein VMF59_11785, partial [Bacteroidota bacterium]|nr:hypothetical protein [Bacteroidota bacterium]
LSDAGGRAVVAGIERGFVVLTDGASPLTRALEIRHSAPASVADVTDRTNPEIRITWPGRQNAPSFEKYPQASSEIVYAARERSIGIIVTRGRGKCLVFAPLVDPLTVKGYTRFPTLPTVLSRALGCRSLISRRGADAYFDPGYRFGRAADDLARMWKSWGLTGIHVAAWYAHGTPPFDYAGLLQALHRNGLLAYAWLEWPYVGKAFWDSHPSWRQKNALLEDAHLDFLYLMDLQNPACMASALGELEDLLALDWDGVDVAEFTLTGAGREALEGPAMPGFFTGFTETGRRAFAKAFGYDPLELFAAGSQHYWKSNPAALKTFYRYRTAVNYETERALFTAMRDADRRGNRSREMMLTIVDNSLHPEFDDLLGFDMNETVALTREFGLTLEVEDPYTEWSSPPDRYTAIRSGYRGLLKGGPFLIDVNVVPLPDDRAPHFSTPQATGTEFLELARYASGDADRVCFYCESSVYAKDWELLPFALAARGSVQGGPLSFVVEAPSTVSIRSGCGNREVRMDGEPWPARGDSAIIVPAGNHRVELGGEDQPKGIRILSITGELVRAAWRGDSLSLTYRSAGRCAVGFSSAPAATALDGTPAALSRSASANGCVVLAPPGTHELTVTRR